MTSPRMHSLCWYTTLSKWPFSCADKHFSGDIYQKGEAGRSNIYAQAKHWLAASSHLERWDLEMLVIHQPQSRAAIFVCGSAQGKNGRDPLFPNPGWSFPLFSQRSRSCKLLECIKPRHKLFAEAKDVTQTPLIRSQGHLFPSCFSKHKKATTLMWSHVPGSSSRQLLPVSLLGTEALLFSSPLPGKPVTCLMGVRGAVWAVTFWKKLMAWWPPRTRALTCGQWPHHQPCAISTQSSSMTTATKGFCCSLREGTNFNLFTLIPSTNGVKCFTHHLLQQKNHNTSEGEKGTWVCPYPHAQSCVKNSGIRFLSEQHRELKPLCDSQQRPGWAAPEYIQCFIPHLCDSKQQPCLSKRIVSLGI